MNRSATIATLALALAGPGTAVHATDLYVAGTVGEVYKGDSVTGGFEQFGGVCLGPVRALAMDDATIYAGDQVGGVVRFDLATGDFLGAFFAPGEVTALVEHEGVLLVSDTQMTIRRYDPASGTLLDTMIAPEPVSTMRIIDGLLYFSGDWGALYRGDPVTGGFEYFGCGCAGLVGGITHDDEFIYAGDAFGQIIYYDRELGWLMGGGFVPFAVTDLQMDGDVLLASDDAGQVHRLDRLTMSVLDTLAAGIDVQAMLIGADPLPPCPADVDGDGAVGVEDAVAVVLAWGSADAAADVDDDGLVGVNDLVTVILAWGPC